MKEIKAEIKILASAEKVWNIISEFQNYSQWNPIIKKITGEPKVGTKIGVHLTTVGGKNRVYHPKIIKVEAPHEIRWYGKFFSSAIFSGERVLTIDKISETEVNFTNKEIFSGLGVKFSPKKMEEDILASFEAMNNSLKKKIELT